MKELFIYNVTSMVNHSIHEEWLKWIQDVHIPDVLSTCMFTHHRILRLLETDETEGVTYAVQYYFRSLENYTHYIHYHAPQLRQKATDKWGDQVIAFRTLMEVIN